MVTLIMSELFYTNWIFQFEQLLNYFRWSNYVKLYFKRFFQKLEKYKPNIISKNKQQIIFCYYIFIFLLYYYLDYLFHLKSNYHVHHVLHHVNTVIEEISIHLNEQNPTRKPDNQMRLGFHCSNSVNSWGWSGVVCCLCLTLPGFCCLKAEVSWRNSFRESLSWSPVPDRLSWPESMISQLQEKTGRGNVSHL